MSDEVIDQVLAVLAANPSLRTLDITGGAPELHPRFQQLVTKARRLEKRVIVRHNLTVAQDPHPLTQESMAYVLEFFREQRVEIVSSLPYYQEFFTNKQRGDGVFVKSIATLQTLNQLGYGKNEDLILNLVYNPVGSYLPPPQADLERQYKTELFNRYGIEFNQVFAITNMPIHRFKAQLSRTASYEDYMEKLVAAFNPSAAEGIMCRNLLSVAFTGQIYDCDFNQMLDLPMFGSGLYLKDFDLARLSERVLNVADHCYACTAGAGSSCGGSTA